MFQPSRWILGTIKLISIQKKSMCEYSLYWLRCFGVGWGIASEGMCALGF